VSSNKTAINKKNNNVVKMQQSMPELNRASLMGFVSLVCDSTKTLRYALVWASMDAYYLGNGLTSCLFFRHIWAEVKEKEFKNMTNKQMEKKRGRGRPVGSGSGTQIVYMIRHSLKAAIEDLELNHNTNLATLISEALRTDVNATLRTIASFAPKNIDVQVTGGSFADALSKASDIIRAEAIDVKDCNNSNEQQEIIQEKNVE